MDNDEKFSFDFVGGLLYNMTARAVLSMIKISAAGGSLSDFWSESDDDLFYYAKLNMVGDNDDDYRLLAYADYLTLIPYGDEGYKVFDEYIRGKSGISAAEWRYNTFLKILGDSAKNYNGAQRARLLRYYESHDLKEVHFDNIDEAAMTFFRLRHRVEAGLKRVSLFGEFDEIWNDTFQRWADELPERQVVSVEEILESVPLPHALTEQEKEFVRGLDSRYSEILE